jgi:hypothetical protein
MNWRTSCAIVNLSHTSDLGSSYFYIWPCLLIATGHDAGAGSSTLLASGNPGAHEADALFRQVSGAAGGVWVMRVTTVDDDVAFFHAALVEEPLDEVINRPSGHDEHHRATEFSEHRDEVLDGAGTDNGLALGFCSASARESRLPSANEPHRLPNIGLS